MENFVLCQTCGKLMENLLKTYGNTYGKLMENFVRQRGTNWYLPVGRPISTRNKFARRCAAVTANEVQFCPALRAGHRQRCTNLRGAVRRSPPTRQRCINLPGAARRVPLPTRSPPKSAKKTVDFAPGFPTYIVNAEKQYRNGVQRRACQRC